MLLSPSTSWSSSPLPSFCYSLAVVYYMHDVDVIRCRKIIYAIGMMSCKVAENRANWGPANICISSYNAQIYYIFSTYIIHRNVQFIYYNTFIQRMQILKIYKRIIYIASWRDIYIAEIEYELIEVKECTLSELGM